MPPTMLASVVLYNTPLAASQTVQGLLRAFEENPSIAESMRVVLCDNSAQPLPQPSLPPAFEYVYMRANTGVAGAFNHALEIAVGTGMQWLLLLDQDTCVTGPFLETMLRHVLSLTDQEDVAWVAPTVVVRGGIVASPRRLLSFGRQRAYPAAEEGIASGEPFAINSGSALRTNALLCVGGFSYDFWLNYCDMDLAHRMYRGGWKMWRAADAVLHHDLSIMDYERSMSPERARSYAEAASDYTDLYRSRMDGAAHSLQLLLRAGKQRFKYSNPEYSRIAFSQLLYRLRTSRETRLERMRRRGDTRREQAGEMNL